VEQRRARSGEGRAAERAGQISLGHWAARSPSGLASGAPVSVDSMILALRSRFRAAGANGLRARYELRLGEDHFRIEVADDAFAVDRGGADRADATIDTDPVTLDAVLWGDRSLADARRSGKLRIEGDEEAVEHFLRLFPMRARAGH